MNRATHSGRRIGPVAAAGALAAGAFWVAFDHGAYALTSRNGIAVVVLWTLLIGASVGLLPLAAVGREALIAGAALGAFAFWTGLSAAWGASSEKAVAELDRVLLYLAVYMLAVLVAPRASARRWLAGLALGVSAVIVLALSSRLFPQLFEAPQQLAQIFPTANKRLSYPVDYWNGLATLAAFGVPLLLYFAVHAPRWVRGLAVAPLPAFAGTIYLTSSRGGALAAAIALVVFLALTSNRWAAAGAAAVAAAGSTISVAALLARDELVDDPFRSAAAESQGRSAALIILLACLGAGAVYALLCAYVPRPRPVSRTVAGAFTMLLVAIGIAALVAAHPVRRVQEFKEIPRELSSASVQQHLLSGSGNGRWQFWQSAVDEFESRPVVGRGAGSYEAWWSEHGTLPVFVRDAHSLYFETLGELGIVGLLLLASFFVTCVVTGLRRLPRRSEAERAGVAALLALAAAYLFEAGTDWMWELTAVSLIAFVALGLLTGPATEPGDGGGEAADAGPRWLSSALRVGAGLLLVAMLVVEAIPLLATMEIRRSEDAAAQNDLREALARAESARSIQGWAASPYLQLALVEELAGDLPRARAAIESALERDASDWRLWLVAARIQTKTGAVAEARRSLERAEQLNPRSPLFSSG